MRNTHAYSGFAGMSILGDFATISECNVTTIAGGDAVGIAVGAVRGLRITQSRVSGCAGNTSILGRGGDAVGILLVGASDSEVTGNRVLNVTGGDGATVDSNAGGYVHPLLFSCILPTIPSVTNTLSEVQRWASQFKMAKT